MCIRDRFREGSEFFLPGSVSHKDGGFATVITQVRRVPAKPELNVEDHVFLKWTCKTVRPQHGAGLEDDVHRRSGAVSGIEFPENTHCITALIAGQHHFNR